MATRDELDRLSSRELHDRAVRRALHHLDVEFLWELLRAIPAAEALRPLYLDYLVKHGGGR